MEPERRYTLGQTALHIFPKRSKSCWCSSVGRGKLMLEQVDYITVAHAVHRLSGIVTPANAAASASELENQLRSSGTKAIVTCQSLLEITLQAAKTLNIPRQNVFILEVFGQESPATFATVKGLISQGSQLPSLEPLRWSKGQGKRQIAFLCYSSGTSGLPVSKLRFLEKKED